MLDRPPFPFPPVRRLVLPAGTRLHRNHLALYPAAAFNPGVGTQMSRFSPFRTADGNAVPTLYAATSREAAAFETVFHNIDAKAPFKTIALADVRRRAVSEIRSKRELHLAPLFAPDLKAWGLRRGDLIDTDESEYEQTVPWAQAIHDADIGIDGLIWTSRQCDPDCCVVLFGDRVAEVELDVSVTRTVASDSGLLSELRIFGRRAGIDIVS